LSHDGGSVLVRNRDCDSVPVSIHGCDNVPVRSRGRDSVPELRSRERGSGPPLERSDRDRWQRPHHSECGTPGRTVHGTRRCFSCWPVVLCRSKHCPLSVRTLSNR